MASAEELIKQRDALQEQIDAALKEERVAALVDVKNKIKLHGFTQTELRSVIKTRKRKSKATSKAKDSSS